MVTQYLWFFSALSAAFLWGLGYVFSERVLKLGITPSFYLFISCIIGTICYGIVIIRKDFRENIEILQTYPESVWLIAFTSIIFVVANFLIFYSVANKNATISSLIEISYPIFTAIFAWVIYKDIQINTTGIIGALFIFGGIICVFIGSK